MTPPEPSQGLTAARTPGERAHYGGFYDEAPDDGRPLLVVLGNCQAESLRRLLASDDVRTVRVPPVHELGPGDVPLLHRLVARTSLLVVQPVGDGYRGLPLGTAQLRALLPEEARVALIPSVRYAGLHPWHLVVHPPGLPDPDPPVVAYHDVRTAALAAGLTPPDLDVLTVARASVAELARRERAGGLVPVSDLLAEPTAESMRTVNHPGNAVLAPFAERIRATLGLPWRPPGTTAPLLTSVLAPLAPEVVTAHRLDGQPRAHWVAGGVEISAAEVAAAHLAWYAERPDVLEVVLTRSRALVSPAGPPGADAPAR